MFCIKAYLNVRIALFGATVKVTKAEMARPTVRIIGHWDIMKRVNNLIHCTLCIELRLKEQKHMNISISRKSGMNKGWH